MINGAKLVEELSFCAIKATNYGFIRIY